MKIRYVKEDDLIYWVERGQNGDGKWCYVVRQGYYLASHLFRNENVHIVTLGDITSTVTRHLSDDFIFLTEEEAQKKADELNIIG